MIILMSEKSGFGKKRALCCGRGGECVWCRVDLGGLLALLGWFAAKLLPPPPPPSPVHALLAFLECVSERGFFSRPRWISLTRLPPVKNDFYVLIFFSFFSSETNYFSVTFLLSIKFHRRPTALPKAFNILLRLMWGSVFLCGRFLLISWRVLSSSLSRARAFPPPPPQS